MFMLGCLYYVYHVGGLFVSDTLQKGDGVLTCGKRRTYRLMPATSNDAHGWCILKHFPEMEGEGGEKERERD